MANLTVASWNIYFSHDLVKESQGSLSIPSGAQGTRANTVASHIQAISPDLIGIIECMPANKLKYFRDKFLPEYSYKIEGTSSRLNLGVFYRRSTLDVTKVSFDEGTWKDQLGDDAGPVTYKWTRVPLVVRAKSDETGAEFIVAVVHPKSKKTYSNNPTAAAAEALQNRKRIVAEGRRLHSILWKLAEDKGSPFDRFLIIGDINDGPWFDEYESRLLRSGVESHMGRVYEPDKVLHTFIDLSDERGQPTTPASWGAPQLDHILYTHDLAHGSSLPQVVPGSGIIRNDLVDFSSGSGKSKDSDHCPVQIQLEV